MTPRPGRGPPRHCHHRPLPNREVTGPSRLLDMIPGRSKKILVSKLNAQWAEFRAGIEVVAMEWFTDFRSIAAEQLPAAFPVRDPFHVVGLAGDALDRCQQHFQQQACRHRGRSGDPLYGVHRNLCTGADLLNGRQ